MAQREICQSSEIAASASTDIDMVFIFINEAIEKKTVLILLKFMLQKNGNLTAENNKKSEQKGSAMCLLLEEQSEFYAIKSS